jgi:hypothetical protein
VVNTGLIGGNVNVGSGSVSNSDGIIGGNVNVHSGTVNSGLIIGSVNIGGKSTFEFVDYQRFAATTAGNLIVNGRNIAFTQVFNDRMYGSVLNFFEAIGANIDINNARLRVDFNGIHISFGISNSSRDTHGNAIVWQEYNRGRFKIEDLHYRTIGRGAEFIISDLQSLINLAGDRVTSLAYDLGSRGGTHIRSSFRTVAILPTDDAIIKWAEMNSNLTLPPSLNLRQDLNLGFADLMMYVDANYADIFHTVFAAQEFATLSRAVAERHPFVTINDYRSWFTLGFGQTNVTGSLPSNIYTLTDRNIGVFRYGVHGIGLPGIHR